jgi:hypothetical protein
MTLYQIYNLTEFNCYFLPLISIHKLIKKQWISLKYIPILTGPVYDNEKENWRILTN